ncbi:hypothetical protein LQ327_24600 [Actinomycetospora endophytica]|uniref:Uncharacterized protein n=1 Tax=Actinomycetospora endophytica TaxID=2291215 RepID=A0ABS8PE61_9PSEU|nr:hypothetical protein [Actinomycetospora endophytica]MCD2196559.1 hypothetical protein [Actinomycetospora endophytica]
MLTKERIGPVIATLAAIAGLVLVLTGAGHKADADDNDNAPSTPPTSQVQPAPGQVQAPVAPGQIAPPQTQAPQQQKDNDGDDDG